MDLLQEGADGLDDLLLGVLENDHVVPTALVIAMYFNFAASLVNPASVAGTFISPFANLSWAEKGAAFAMIEEQHADLVQGIDSNLPEPLDEYVSGLLHFVPGALLEFIGFGTYSEFHQLDRSIDPLRLQGRPVGWELTGYQPGMLTRGHGWDELLGYHKGSAPWRARGTTARGCSTVRDVIVIGAGGGGAVVAKELAERGLDVLVLEAGPHYDDAEQVWSKFENDANNVVLSDTPISSIDDRVTAAVLGNAAGGPAPAPVPVAPPSGAGGSRLPATGGGAAPLVGAAALAAAAAVRAGTQRLDGHRPDCPSEGEARG